MIVERILVVDDEPDILELVRYNLSNEGFRVDTATTGNEALSQITRSKPDLVVLDLMLPDQSGMEICKKLRANPSFEQLPIIMLTARSEEVDRVVGFEIGADDYVTKPFSPRELALRIRSVLRRTSNTGSTDSRLERDELVLDRESHRCTVAEQEVELTTKEFDLLATLMRRPGQVRTREQLIESVWGSDFSVSSRTVDTHLKRLREKIGPYAELIQTVRGVGYRFSD
ncbi:MAG: response regulator transcription factor [Myxococcota bacterium]|nr:response regulator transcription factor [Myxococcota bacterium]